MRELCFTEREASGFVMAWPGKGSLRGLEAGERTISVFQAEGPTRVKSQDGEDLGTFSDNDLLFLFNSNLWDKKHFLTAIQNTHASKTKISCNSPTSNTKMHSYFLLLQVH